MKTLSGFAYNVVDIYISSIGKLSIKLGVDISPNPVRLHTLQATYLLIQRHPQFGPASSKPLRIYYEILAFTRFRNKDFLDLLTRFISNNYYIRLLLLIL